MKQNLSAHSVHSVNKTKGNKRTKYQARVISVKQLTPCLPLQNTKVLGPVFLALASSSDPACCVRFLTCTSLCLTALQRVTHNYRSLIDKQVVNDSMWLHNLASMPTTAAGSDTVQRRKLYPSSLRHVSCTCVGGPVATTELPSLQHYRIPR